MADHLKIDGGQSTPEGTAQKTGEGDTREQGELERLRAIAKRHHGRELDDKTLKAMVAHRKAKIAKSQARDAAARAFQKGQTREQVSHEVAEQETRARRAIGAEQTRGASAELHSKNSRQVRCNPNSGPQLPPTLDKATTAEQAARLIDKMFGFVTVDGEAFDAKAYSETLRQAPASQPKGPANSRQQQTAKTLQPQTRPPSQPRRVGQSFSRPAAPLTISTRGGSPAARASSPNPNSLSSGTGVSADGLFNAGGGLITNSSFDGMRFNWEAFNWFFTMVVMKDLHKYRRELKELRRAQGDAAIAGMRLKLAIAEIRHTSERKKASAAFFEQVKGAVGKINSENLEAEAQNQVGQAEKQREKNSVEQEKTKAQLQELRERRAQLEEQLRAPSQAQDGGRAPTSRGSTTLGNLDRDIGKLESGLKELEAEEKALRGKIGDMKFEAKEAEGAIGDLARAMPSLSSLSLTDGRFAERAKTYRQSLEQLMLRREVAPYLEQRGTEMSASLRQRINDIHNQDRVPSRNEEDAAGRTRFARDLSGVGSRLNSQDALDHTAKKVLLHELALALTTPLEKRQAAVKAATDEIVAARNGAAAAYTNGDRESADSLAARVEELERAKQVLDAAAKPDASPQSVLDAAMAQPLEDAGLSEVARVADTMRIAGAMWRTEREDRGRLTVPDELSGSLAETMNQVQEGAATSGETAQGAADQALETSIDLHLQARSEANAMLRRHTSHAQGMINQLMQLLRMQRNT